VDRPEPNPEQDRRVLLAVVLSFLVLWVFSYFAPEPPPRPVPLGDDDSADGDVSTPGDEDLSNDSDRPTSSGDAAGEGTGSDDDDSASTLASSAAVEPKIVRAPLVETDFNWKGTETRWSSRGGSPSSIRISGYQEAYEQQWLPTWLLSGLGAGGQWEPFSLACPTSDVVNIVKDPSGVVLQVGIDEDGVDADLANYHVVPSDDSRRLNYRVERGDIEITKSYLLPEEGHLSSYIVRLRNRGSVARQVLPSFGISDQILPSTGGLLNYGPMGETWADVDGDVEHQGAEALEKKVRDYEGEVSWLAMGDRYFFVGLEPEQPILGQVVMRPSTVGEQRYTTEVRSQTLTLEPGESRTYKFKLWMGPKELERLQDSNLRMETAVDFGMFGVLSLPILAFLKFLNGLLGSWGLAIIALTISIKLAVFPLSQKSYRSMKGMQALQPEINELKEKHGDDKEALNREMMELWKTHGVNPMGGCLPMLIQMPIWFALYRVLWNSVELYQQPFLYFCDLSLRDPLGVFPIALGVTMFAQQKFTPNTATDPTQKMVMKLMPLIFSVMMFTLPAGLVVYILVNNILSIGQQWVIHRQNDDDDDSDKKGTASDKTGSSGSGKK